MKATVKLSGGRSVTASVRDIDLDKEVVLNADGTRYTEAQAAADAADIIERQGRGKPSLSGRGTSPQIGIRLPAELRERLAECASAEGRRESELVRDAIERYLQDRQAS